MRPDLHRRPRVTRVRRRAAAVFAAVALLVPVAGPGSAATVPEDDERSVDELRDDIDQNDRAIDDTRDELDETRTRISTVTTQVLESDATIVAYESELSALQQRLVVAQEQARAAGVRTDEARAALARLDTELRTTELALDEQQDVLHDRAVSAFMYGEATVADAVAGSRSVNDFVSTTYYLRTVLLADIDIVEEVDALRGSLVDARAESDRLREVVEAEQLVAEAARIELEDLTSAQERLTVLAGEERARRASLLRELEIHEAATEAQLVELEVESSALEEQLRQVQWRAGSPGEGTWVWPTSGRVGSGYGYRVHPIWGGTRLHAGVDVGAPYGQVIVAGNDGLVLTASCSSGGYGCRVVIDHGGGFASLYAHQSSFAVVAGEVVAAGQTIGYVGSTGASTGPHLHFEIRRNGAPEDPMQHYGR